MPGRITGDRSLPGCESCQSSSKSQQPAISSRGRKPGIDHLGIEVDDEGALHEVEARLHSAEAEVVEQRGAACCYAESDKSWSFDPDGVVWETFVSHRAAEEFGEDSRTTAIAIHGALAGPA